MRVITGEVPADQTGDERMQTDPRTAVAITATVISLAACGGPATQSASTGGTGTDPLEGGTLLTAPVPAETLSSGPTVPPTTAPPVSTASVETSTTAVPETVATPTTAAPTTAAPTTAAPTTTLAPARPLEDAIGGTAQLDGWVVDAGRYSTERIGVGLELDLDRPVTWIEARDLVILGRDGLSGDQVDLLFVMQPVGVIPAADAGVHPPHDPVVPATTADLPDDLGGWLSAIAALEVTGTGELETLDGPARFWDIVVDETAGQTFGCFLGDCVANFVVGELGAFVFGDELHFRVYQLPGSGDHGVVAFVQARPDQFDGTVALADAILSRMTVVG